MKVFLLLLIFCEPKASYESQSKLVLPFLTEKLVFNHFTVPKDTIAESFKASFDRLEISSLLYELQGYRKHYQYSDWFFYQLIWNLAIMVYEDNSYVQSTLFSWYILTKLGYDIRVVKDGSFYALYAKTTDEALNSIQLNQKVFTGLNTNYAVENFAERNIAINPDGKAFNFKFNNYPNILEKWDDIYTLRTPNQEIDVNINFALITMVHLDSYPYLKDTEYVINIPFSKTMQLSLGPIKNELAILSDRDATETLFNFCKDNFVWMDYEQITSEELRLQSFPEQLLYATAGYIYDYTALLYALIKSTLNLPMVVIELEREREIILGVYLSGIEYEGFMYKGLNYMIYDPRENQIGVTGSLEGANILFEHNP